MNQILKTYEYQGESYTVSQIHAIFEGKISEATIRKRINLYGINKTMEMGSADGRKTKKDRNPSVKPPIYLYPYQGQQLSAKEIATLIRPDVDSVEMFKLATRFRGWEKKFGIEEAVERLKKAKLPVSKNNRNEHPYINLSDIDGTAPPPGQELEDQRMIHQLQCKGIPDDEILIKLRRM